MIENSNFDNFTLKSKMKSAVFVEGHVPDFNMPANERKKGVSSYIPESQLTHLEINKTNSMFGSLVMTKNDIMNDDVSMSASTC